jgi:exopolyphosphatase / guanosine-5'-triphosphate,3'-diphosphate pyrophosphatase
LEFLYHRAKGARVFSSSPIAEVACAEAKVAPGKILTVEAIAKTVQPGDEFAGLGRVEDRKQQSHGKAVLPGPVFGALDLGTNNCRLLIARPDNNRLRIVDAFSRIVRLGEGFSMTGELSAAAMDRTIEALRVCSNKLKWHGVSKARLIATEACRSARNGTAFIKRVETEIGLALEIIDRSTEAELAAAGAEPLIDRDAESALVFDIGGGSTEVMWMGQNQGQFVLEHWVSLAAGVVTLSERTGGGKTVGADDYMKMRLAVRTLLEPFVAQISLASGGQTAPTHILGTSGTVTTIAGVHLKLRHYDRAQVDGCWLSAAEVNKAVRDLSNMSYEDRVKHGCIGRERADLVLAGCAILDEIMMAFPSKRVRVADRGLREGILARLWQAHINEGLVS